MCLVRVAAGVLAGGRADAGAVRGGLPDLGEHKRAEQPAGFLAKQALGHAGEQHTAIQDRVKVEAGGAAGGDPVHERPQEEGAELVEHRADGLGAAPAAELLVPAPETTQPDRIVTHRGDVGPPELRVGQQPGHVGQGGTAGWVAQQGQAGGAEDVVGAWSPVGGEDAAEDPNDVVDGQVGVWPLEHVEDRRGVAVLGVEQHQPLGDLGGQPVEQVADEVAVGVDDDGAASGGDIVQHHVGDQGGLADAGRAKQVQVVAGVLRRERDRPGGAAVGVAEDLADGTQPGHRRDRPGRRPGQAGDGRVSRQVRQRGKLGGGQQAPVAQHACGQGCGGAVEPVALEPVAIVVQSERRGQRVRAAPQPLAGRRTVAEEETP